MVFNKRLNEASKETISNTKVVNCIKKLMLFSQNKRINNVNQSKTSAHFQWVTLKLPGRPSKFF